MSTSPNTEGHVPEEVTTILHNHQEAIVIVVDPVVSTEESAVSAFIKMLDKDKGGKLATLLDDILTNLKATHGKKCGGLQSKAAASP
jgi:hypothetical protein